MVFVYTDSVKLHVFEEDRTEAKIMVRGGKMRVDNCLK
jgi:hypothetical protein